MDGFPTIRWFIATSLAPRRRQYREFFPGARKESLLDREARSGALEAQAAAGGGSLVSRLMPRPPRPSSPPRDIPTSEGRDRSVWVVRDGQPVAVSISIGTTDARMTEVVAGIEPGAAVIVDTIARGSRS